MAVSFDEPSTPSVCSALFILVANACRALCNLTCRTHLTMRAQLFPVAHREVSAQERVNRFIQCAQHMISVRCSLDMDVHG